MKLVIVFWALLFTLLIVQVAAIVKELKKSTENIDGLYYSKKTLEKTETAMNAIVGGVVKKNIIKNSASNQDNSQVMMTQYKTFLSSKLMDEISEMNEEVYNG